MAESESQKRYNKKYQQEHRDKQRYYVAKSTTKNFILNANDKDIPKIKKWLKIRENK